MKVKKVIILGGSGFIGKSLVNFFSKLKNYNVTATFNKNKPIIINKKVKWLKADLRIYDDCLKVLKNKDIVIQCAATTSGSKTILKKPYEHVTDNAIINSQILRASYERKIKHFIFTSCTVMYGHSKKGLNENNVNEKKIFKPYYGVANTKLYIEKMCKFYSDISNIKFSIIRHSNIYGPYDKFDLNMGHFMATAIMKAQNKNNKTILINGHGNEKRDFLYIDDLINFIKLLIHKQKSNFEIINCTYGRSYSINEILKKIIRFSKNKKTVEKNLLNKSLNVDILVNSLKAKKILKWKPRVRLHEGIKKTINWYRNNSSI